MKRPDIIQLIIEEQQKIIDSLEESVERYRTASDLDEESTHDPEDFSQQTQAKDLQLRFEKMLAEAEHNKTFLEKEKENIHTEVGNGSLIETDKNWMFIGISVPVFKVGKKELLSFSEKAPVFDSIKGKKEGEKIKIGENTFEILKFL